MRILADAAPGGMRVSCCAMKLTPQTSIWLDGKLVPWDQAQVHVLSHALHYASSVFEGIRAYATPSGPAVLALDAHIDRLLQSCRIVHLPVPWTKSQLMEAVLAVVADNGHESCYIRPLVFRGYGALGVWPEEAPVQTAIACFPWHRPNEEQLLAQGLRVGVSSWRRMAPDTLPATAKVAGNYVNSALVVMEAKRHGYDEGIALDIDGYLSEGSGQNLFLVERGTLWTPPAGESILVGITRGIVIDIARELGIPVREERLPRERLYTCDEVFLTGTVAEVVPVREVDGKTVGAGRRGPVTERIQQRYFRLVRGFEPDTRGLLTPVRGSASVP